MPLAGPALNPASPASSGGHRYPCCSTENMVMNALDFSSLFRSAIGFDRLMRLADTATRSDASVSYPPYNIEKTGDESYRLTMAVAGFGAEDLELRVQENALFVTGKARKEEETAQYLHRGIASR